MNMSWHSITSVYIFSNTFKTGCLMEECSTNAFSNNIPICIKTNILVSNHIQLFKNLVNLQLSQGQILGTGGTALSRNSATLVQKHNKNNSTLEHFFGLGKCSLGLLLFRNIQFNNPTSISHS